MAARVYPARKAPAKARPQSLEMQLLAAKVAMDDAKLAYDALADRARAELSLGHHLDGDADVLITPNRQLDKVKALEAFGDEICSLQFDTSKARAVMTGEEYNSFFVEGPPKVSVRWRIER